MLGLGNILTKGGAVLAFPNKYSFNFDGSNNSLQLNVGNGLISKADIEANGESFSAWIKLDNVSGTKYIVCHGRTVTEDNAVYGGIYVEGATAKFRLYKNSAYQTISGTTTLSADTWYHIVGTYDGENNDDKMRIYINGSLEATSSAIGGDFITGEPTLAHIGRNVNTGSSSKFYFFDGLIDEVAIWDTALSASDVAKIASKPVDLSKPSKYATDRTSNLKLWLRCGDKAEPESNTAIARQDFYTDFDGTDDYVSVADNDVLDFGTGDFTITSWFNQTTAQSALVAKGSFGGEGDFLIYDLGDGGSGAGKMIFRNDDNTGQNQFDFTSSTFNNAGWTHIAVTRSGQTITTYTNGSQHATGSLEANYDFSNAHNVSIGAREDGTQRYFGGAISNISFYQTALDAQTISQMAKSRFTPMRDNRFSVVDFDGSDDYIAIPDNDSLDIGTGNVTVSAWVKPTDLDASYTILDKRGSSDLGIRLTIHSGDRIFFQIGDGSDTYFDYSGSLLTLGQWHHVCAVWNPSTTYAKFYLDGIDVGRQFDSTNANVGNSDNTSELRIGRASSGYTNTYFKGSISSVSVYNVEKSAEEVYALYSKGITYNESSESGLVGLWRMGDDTSKAFPTIADSSSNSNDGTMTNMASDDIVQQMVAGYDMGAFESSTEELGGNLVANATDWTDSNSDGLADNWSDQYSGKLDYSIVTGNGFTGNAQRFEVNDVAGNDRAIRTSSTVFTSGTLYKVSFKYRASISSGSILVMDGGSGATVTNITTHTGDAKLFETFYVAPTGSHLWFYMQNADANAFMEIDEVSVREPLQSEVSDTHPAIIDVNEPVLGVEIISANTTSEWGQYGSGGSEADIDNGVSLTTGSDSRNAYRTVSGLTDGKLYKLSVDAYYSGSVDDCKIEIIPGSGSLYTPALTTTSTNYTIYFVKNNSTMYILGHSFVTKTDSTPGNVLYIQNLSIKEIQGNVGTMTQMLSSNLVYSSVLPDQSFLTGVNSAYNFIDLDGSDEYIDCGTGTQSLINDATKTVSAWVNIDSGTSGEKRIIVFHKSSGATRWGLGWNEPSNANKFFASYNPSDSHSRVYSSSTYSAGSGWYHIASVQDGANVTLYINGVSKGTASDASASPNVTLSSQSTLIGNLAGYSYHWNGKIGVTSVWNKALSATEVSAIYTAGRHSKLLDSYSDNLKGYWAMSALDASTGLSDVGNGTIYDRSGNSNHGTATNTESADLKSSPNAEPNGYAKGDTNRSTTTP